MSIILIAKQGNTSIGSQKVDKMRDKKKKITANRRAKIKQQYKKDR